FQAEDGIRDLIVTGVQTCALPISARSTSDALWDHAFVRRRNVGTADAGVARAHEAEREVREPVAVRPRVVVDIGDDVPACGGQRSEERRVGKEWRSRRSPCDGRKT